MSKLPNLDILETLKKVWRKCQILFIVLSGVYLISWIIPPVRVFLTAIGMFEQNTMFYIVALSTTLIVTILSELKNLLSDLSKKLDKFNKESNSQIIENGVLHVYPHLNKILDAISNKREKKLDVIGLTLYSAWPQIQAWLTLDSTRDWTIQLYAIDSDFINNHNHIMPGKWTKEADSAKDQIEYFINDKSALLTTKAISLRFDTYSNLPGIHGFKLGDGTLYLSFSHWSDKDLVDDPHYFYEYFHCEDKTTRAKAYRKLFDNWLIYYKNKSSE